MASSVRLSSLLMVLLLLFSTRALAEPRCGIQGKGVTCADLGQPSHCCSRFGYCGASPNHCGIGCQNGCPPPSPSSSSSSSFPSTPSFSSPAVTSAMEAVSQAVSSIPEVLDPASLLINPPSPSSSSTSSDSAPVLPSSSATSPSSSSPAVVDVPLASPVTSSYSPSSSSSSTDTFSDAYIYDDPQSSVVYQALNTLTSQVNTAASSLPYSVVRCGRQVRGNLTCAQLGYPGQCCSEFGYCGSLTDHCGRGCQSGCGPTDYITDASQTGAGRCGMQGTGRACAQQCCSAYGYCGLSDVHCGKGCQSGCTPADRMPPTPLPTLPPVVPVYPQAKSQPVYAPNTPSPAPPMFYPVGVDVPPAPTYAPTYPTPAGMRGGCLGSGPTYQGAASILSASGVDDTSCAYSDYRTPDSMDAYVAFLGTQFWEGVDACGGCVCVHGPNDYVVAKIVGQRPLMNSDMLLSEEAYSQIAPKTWGQATVSWQYIPCPSSGPVSYYFRPGSDALFPSVQVRNHKYRVSRIEIYKDNVWSDLTLSKGFWSRSLYGGSSGPFSIRITSVNGETLMDRFDSYTPGRAIPGAANFS